ncbi:MAG TPA: DUF1360 domain-containing protein [Miltoncostaeaceae bacterium]|nr:DUF1360 domain-containing protein [Miltoncostaeaceae bacterium]
METRAETRDRRQERYADVPIPLRDYAGLAALFNVAMVGGLALAERSGRRIPERVSAADIALLGVATHKVSRLITKDRVTAFVRAPFTRYEEPAGHGELEEHARGTGARRAVGQLLSCPYCISQWVAGGFFLGLVAAPRPTRLAAAMFTAVFVSDGLQLAWKAAESRATP